MASKDESERKPPAGLLPPVWLLLAIGLMLLVWWLVPVRVIVPWPYNLSGVVLVAVGIGFAVAGNLQFKQHGTAIKPFQKSSALVTTGVFRFSRNPMYVGMVVLLLGLAVLLGALTALTVPVCYAIFLRFAFVIPEEEAMTEQFGDDYLNYQTRVRRWL